MLIKRVEAFTIENRYKINLDFKQRSILNINFIQNNIDTGVIEFTITNGGQVVNITGQDISIAFLKPDSTLVIQDFTSGVTILDGLNGKVECVLKSNTLAAVGIVKGEISFSESGKKLSTATFNFTVSASIDNGEAIISTNELPKLDAKMLDIQAQYNDDSAVWNSNTNNKIAEATNKIAETEATRLLTVTATNNANTATTNTNAAITSANNAVTNINNNTFMVYKGVKQTYAELPASGNVLGDVWTVANNTADTTKNGTWRYNGSAFIQTYQFNPSGVPVIAQLNAIDVAKAGLVRSTRHSGVVNYLPITTGSTTDLDSITIPETTYSMNGYEITMPLTVVTLPTAPTTGTWDDLVFLESWFPTNGNGYVQSARYRTVSNVNFISYPLDGVTKDTSGTNNADFNLNITPQGGNASPLSVNTNASFVSNFTCQKQRAGTNLPATSDVGVYTAGTGDATSKSTLATYDGIDYLIPLFRVKRRNSSGFSPSNPNGARNIFFLTKDVGQYVFASTIYPTQTVQVTFNATDYANLQVGDTIWHSTNHAYSYQVISKDGSNVATMKNVGSVESSTLPNAYCLKSDRPDNTYANVIDTRDIPPQYDLRHETKAHYDYNYKLATASNDFMSGRLSPKKLLKTYHGIPKTETDINTVFYASLDGTLVPEFPLGSNAMNLGTGSFKLMPTGSGYKFNGDSATPVAVSGLSATEGTVDFQINAQELLKNETASFGCPLIVLDASNAPIFIIYFAKSGAGLYAVEVYADASNVSTGSYPYVVKPTDTSLKIRFSWDATNLYFRVKGNLIRSVTRSTSAKLIPAKVVLGGTLDPIYGIKSTMSDVSLSSIDRGGIDYNLPPDFISGDAQIMPAYTEQRRILSQAQMTQTVNGIIKATNLLNSRGLSRVVIGTPDTWSATDTVAITGKAGELISGVFDADTAIARVAKQAVVNTTGTFYLDDVSKLEVNDTFKFVRNDNGLIFDGTVTAKDATNKTIDYSTAQTLSTAYEGSMIYETTATSSVPIAYHMVAGVKTPVVVSGWTGLGTNVATGTLGTNADLVAQDVQIDYSLIMPAGQPALSVPTTTTLAGEAGFRVPVANQTIVGDYVGKIAGRTWENPNVAKTGSKVVASNPAPSTFTTELVTSEYEKIYTQNGTVTTFSTSVNGEQACILKSFDVIKIAEKELGCKIPASTLAGKVAWLKSNLNSSATPAYGLVAKIYCNGSSPAGNKATLAHWGGEWLGQMANTASSPTSITYPLGYFADRIDANGYFQVICYADPSDGVTPSTINVDFASLDIKFADKIVISYGLVVGSASSVVVRDDFAGKVAGSVVENPNIFKRIATGFSSLQSPSSGNFGEIGSYPAISTLNADIYSSSTSVNGEIPQHLISKNIVSIFEDKYFTIPTLDKVQWLKDNLGSIIPNWWGYATNPGASNADFSCWISNTWVRLTNTLATSVSKLTYTLTGDNLVNSIDSDGFIHLLANANASDGVTASTIYTDYCNIELTLKSTLFPAGYDVLVPSNVRRDASGSAILLVNKNNKEVQSLFNTNVDLGITTYSEYLPPADILTATTDVTILAEADDWTLTDISSSSMSKTNIHHWGNIANRVNLDNDNLYSELGYSLVKFAPDSKNINVGAKIQVGALGFVGNYWKQYALNTISKPMVALARYLVLHNGEIKLFVFSKYSATGGFVTDNTGVGMLVKCQGSPLLKAEDGVVRSGVNTPTVWKSNPLVVEGFVEKATNTLITS